MKFPLKYLVALLATTLSSCETSTSANKQVAPTALSSAPSSIAPTIAPGCELPELAGPRKDYPRPDFPAEQARAGKSGFAELDFEIGEDGKPKNIEAIAGNPGKAFAAHSASALKKLVFSVSPSWVKNCTSQKFRIGYQYAFNSECNPTLFPRGLPNVCTTGYILRLQ